MKHTEFLQKDLQSSDLLKFTMLLRSQKNKEKNKATIESNVRFWPKADIAGAVELADGSQPGAFE